MISPIKLDISGEYWDCQSYADMLFLWNLDDQLITITWEEILKRISSDTESEFFLRCAFFDSRYPYSLNKYKAHNNTPLKETLTNQFNNLAKQSIQIDIKDIKHKVYKNPFNEPPIDSEIMNGVFYASTNKGFYKTNSVFNPDKITKIWDCVLLSLTGNATRNGRISLAAGSEGLYQIYLGNDNLKVKKYIEKSNNIFEVKKSHTNFSNWMKNNVYASSVTEKSFLATYEIQKKKEERKKSIIEKDIISSDNLFLDKSISLSWGNGDKIYKVNKNGVNLVNLSYRDSNEVFSNDAFIKIKEIDSEVVKGGTSYFGTILELEDKLIIARSDGKIDIIDEPVGKWRIYPRSKRFQNHLHVLLEDKISIYAYNHDFLVDQNKKYFGIKQDFKDY